MVKRKRAVAMKKTSRFIALCIIAAVTIAAVIGPHLVKAQTPPTGSTQQSSGTTGLQGKVSGPPPSTPATISTPTNGGSFTSLPITISGLCTTGLVVKIFSNNIFIGAAECKTGSYSLQVDLFGGDNELVARVFDALDQAGPDSNKIHVTFQDGQFAAFGQRISLSSTIAKLGAPVGTTLTWPIVISGGTGPYAISVDWGDGTAADLKSVSFAGTFDINHVYKSAGIYRVVVKATDSTGAVAFLQVVGVGSGEAGQSTTGSKSASGGGGNTVTKVKYVWWPVLSILPFALAAFWIGTRFELSAIHRQLDRQAKIYETEIQR